MPPKIDKWDGISIFLTALFLFVFLGGNTSIATQVLGVSAVLVVLYLLRIYRRLKAKQITGPLDDLRQLLRDPKTRLTALISLGLVLIIYYRILTGALVG